MPRTTKTRRSEKIEKASKQLRNEAQLKTELEDYLKAIAVDEECLLANLVFDPIVAGRQLSELHFSSNDFQGAESNKVLLAVMLEILEAGYQLNLPNLMEKLSNEKHGPMLKIDVVGGVERIQKLFKTPFGSPGVDMLDDLEPLVDKIRDRNVRDESHRLMIEFSERMLQEKKDAYEILGDCIQNMRSLFLKGSAGYLKSLESHIAEIEELVAVNRRRKKSYLGYETNFPVLMERLNGFQKEFYLITGGVGMGKSTFATQLAWDLVTLNPELTVIFFSLDLNRIDATAKMVSQAAEVPIDYVKNPYLERTEFEDSRIHGLNTVAKMQSRLILIDESSGRLFMEDLKKYVKRTKLERGGDVAVVIDPIFKIQTRNQASMSFNEKCNYLSSELKSLSSVEGVTVIATAGLPKAVSNRRPVREDLEEIMGLLYDPYAVFFLYSDYLNDFETPFLEWEWGEESFMIPISEVLIAKNKMGSINARVFYRYYESYSKYKECAPQEVENYSAMIDNLEKYKEDKKRDPSRSSGRSEEF